MAVPNKEDSGHLGFLDGLRGGAALWVLVAHCMIWGGWYGVPVPSPKIAVDIFMVVSGFLMVFQYARREGVERLDSTRTAIRFWLRRFFRIAPVYYVLLLFLVIFWRQHAQGLAALQAASPDRWPTPSAYDVTNYEMTPANVLLHATFLFGFVPKYVFATLLPDWSIALEMQFYAFFPLLFLVFRRISWIGLLIVGVGASVCCNHIFGRLPGPFSSVGLYPEPSLLLMKLPLFLIGMLGAEVFLSAKHKPRESALMTILAVLLAAHYSILTGLVAGLICFLAWSRIPDNSRNTSAAVVASWLNRLLSNRCTAFMADASYSVYLTHCVLISLLGGFLFRRPDFVALSAPLRVAILVAVVAAGAYLLAWVLHNVVEKPGIELGKRLANWWLPVTAAVKTSNGRAATVNQPHTVATTNAYD